MINHQYKIGDLIELESGQRLFVVDYHGNEQVHLGFISPLDYSINMKEGKVMVYKDLCTIHVSLIKLIESIDENENVIEIDKKIERVGFG